MKKKTDKWTNWPIRSHFTTHIWAYVI